MIKIYIVEDHSVVADGIKSLLQNEKDFDVLGYAGTGKDCLYFF
jgi:DNA-binding NarL/FixJ family response regulator